MQNCFPYLFTWTNNAFTLLCSAALRVRPRRRQEPFWRKNPGGLAQTCPLGGAATWEKGRARGSKQNIWELSRIKTIVNFKSTLNLTKLILMCLSFVYWNNIHAGPRRTTSVDSTLSNLRKWSASNWRLHKDSLETMIPKSKDKYIINTFYVFIVV